jgi:hypothetical protein
MQPTRPVATVHPAPAAPAPIPLWEAHRLFREPTYADGQPYEPPAAADDGEGDDLECPAA